MRAAVVTRYGPPEVLEIRDVPAPVPQDHVVCVRVLRRPKTAILGADLAGTGDRVFGSRGDKFGAYAEFACVAEDGFLATTPRNMTRRRTSPATARWLRAVIGRTYPLADIVEAHRYADADHKVGNVVVVIP